MNKTVTPEHGGTYALRSKNYVATGCNEFARLHFLKDTTDGDQYILDILKSRALSQDVVSAAKSVLTPPQNGKEILGTQVGTVPGTCDARTEDGSWTLVAGLYSVSGCTSDQRDFFNQLPNLDERVRYLRELQLIQKTPGAVAAHQSLRAKTNPALSVAELNSILNERGSRYGKFIAHATITQILKGSIRKHLANQGRTLEADHQEALDMICHKIGRIVNGDPNYADSWIDIAGYAKLVSDKLEGVTR